MNKLNIKLFFKKRKQRLSVFGFSPRVDWLFILAVFVFSVVYGIIYALYLYININNNSFFQVKKDTGLQVEIDTKKEEIERVVEFLQN